MECIDSAIGFFVSDWETKSDSFGNIFGRLDARCSLKIDLCD
jgi:hypothetical protein